MTRTGTALAVLVIALLAPAAGRAAAAEFTPWRHGIVQPKSDSGILLMPAEGFAARQGLKLDYQPLQGDPIGFRAADPEPSIPLDKLAWMEDQALALGDLKTRIDLATITDPSIRQDALARLER